VESLIVLWLENTALVMASRMMAFMIPLNKISD
jgi:hypothetical protein